MTGWRASAAIASTAPARGDWRIYRRLLHYVRSMWPFFFVALVGYALGNGAEAYFARLFGDIVQALAHPAANDWLVFPLLMLCAVLVRGFGEFAGDFFLSRVSYRVVHRLRCELFDQLLAMPSAYFDRTARGHLVSRITFNVAQLRDAATDALKTVIQDGSKVAILIGSMFWANWRLTMTFAVIAPIVALIVATASRRFRRISRRIQDSMADVTHVATETVEGYRVVKVFGGEDYERRRFDRSSNANQRQNLKMVATKAWSTQVVQIFVACALALLIGLLFQPQIGGAMSAGDVVYFVGLAGLLARPIKKLSEVSPRLQRGLAAAEDVFDQLDQRTEDDAGTLVAERVRGRIEFREVSFDYDVGTGAALERLSFTIEPGQRVAVVGRSGSGKSTLASLLPRFYEPTSGEILLDGVPVGRYTLKSLRAQIALVSQQVVLFNDTLAHNIAYGALADADAGAIDDAVRRAHASSFIDALPKRLETVVGDDGVLLSGGQRQRVAIARALLKNAPILILDEATSSLDTESEKHIQAALEEVMRDRTTVVIAHRLSTIERADVILVIDGGRLVERGTHHELLARRGLYWRLYEANFDDATPIAAIAPRPSVAPAIERIEAMPAPISHLRWYQDAGWWYRDSFRSRLLAPLGQLYAWNAVRRRTNALRGRPAPYRAPVPVIVVGNITAGGTGKTPLVIWLAAWLERAGFKPGIVARGYPGRSARYPIAATIDASPDEVGDEAPIVARRTGRLVVADPDRARAVRWLVANSDCDIVVADDGLQHYALARDVEVAVIDGQRGLGNRRCIPAGPLREPIERLASVDWVVSSGRAMGLSDREHVMTLAPCAFVRVSDGERRAADAFCGTRVHAAAGIGNADRFFAALAPLATIGSAHRFADHHRFVERDLDFGEPWPVIVTEKDAIKIARLDRMRLTRDIWYLEVEATFSAAAVEALRDVLARHGIRVPAARAGSESRSSALAERWS